MLVHGERHAEWLQVDVNVRNLLQAYGVRPRARDLIRNGLRARRIRSLADRLDRGHQRREVVVGIRRYEGLNHQIHIRADVEVLRHHRDGAGTRRR